MDKKQGTKSHVLHWREFAHEHVSVSQVGTVFIHPVCAMGMYRCAHSCMAAQLCVHVHVGVHAIVHDKSVCSGMYMCTPVPAWVSMQDCVRVQVWGLCMHARCCVCVVCACVCVHRAVHACLCVCARVYIRRGVPVCMCACIPTHPRGVHAHTCVHIPGLCLHAHVCVPRGVHVHTGVYMPQIRAWMCVHAHLHIPSALRAQTLVHMPGPCLDACARAHVPRGVHCVHTRVQAPGLCTQLRACVQVCACPGRARAYERVSNAPPPPSPSPFQVCARARACLREPHGADGGGRWGGGDGQGDIEGCGGGMAGPPRAPRPEPSGAERSRAGPRRAGGWPPASPFS